MTGVDSTVAILVGFLVGLPLGALVMMPVVAWMLYIGPCPPPHDRSALARLARRIHEWRYWQRCEAVYPYDHHRDAFTWPRRLARFIR